MCKCMPWNAAPVARVSWSTVYSVLLPFQLCLCVCVCKLSLTSVQCQAMPNELVSQVPTFGNYIHVACLYCCCCCCICTFVVALLIIHRNFDLNLPFACKLYKDVVNCGSHLTTTSSNSVT